MDAAPSSAATTFDPAVAPAPPGARGRQWFFGHPGGLATLACTEIGVGFSYYGMQSLLVLYMTSQLLLAPHVGRIIGFAPFHALLNTLYGLREGPALATSIMGLYSALVWATPLLGGFIADRLLGRTRTIVLGAILMTVGHFLMAFDASFLIALTFILLGMGCGGCIKAQVGALYPKGDTRRADAFQIYTLAVNMAVIVAPLICGTLGEEYAWHWGFAAAGVGMLLGLVVYLAGKRSLPAESRAIRDGVERPAMTPPERRSVLILIAILPLLGLVGIGNQEIFNGYILWGQKNYQLNFFGHVMPVSWLLSLDAFVSVITLLMAVMFWRWWGKRRPDPPEIVKMGIGGLIAAGGPAVLALASLRAAGGHKVGLIWGLGFHFVNDIGFANFYPVGIALFARVAPPSVNATVINSYSLFLFLASLIVGYLAGLMQVIPAPQFWALHAVVIAAASIGLLLYGKLFPDILLPRPQRGGATR